MMLLMYLGLAGRYKKSYSVRELSILFKTKKEVIEYLIMENLPKIDEYEKMDNSKLRKDL
jgi:hypothetical protein